MIAVKYPFVHVVLLGAEANAFFLIGKTKQALKRSRLVSESEILQFEEEAQSGDFDNVLQTIMAWVSHDLDDEEQIERKEMLERAQEIVAERGEYFWNPEWNEELSL